jgi:hypothetical protein
MIERAAQWTGERDHAPGLQLQQLPRPILLVVTLLLSGGGGYWILDWWQQAAMIAFPRSTLPANHTVDQALAPMNGPGERHYYARERSARAATMMNVHHLRHRWHRNLRVVEPRESHLVADRTSDIVATSSITLHG